MSTIEAQARILLSVDSLAKRYGDQVALADVAFAVGAGEIIGIIGPNGAGKTTLLAGLAGIIPMDSGNLQWCGKPLPPWRRREAIFYLPTGCDPIRIKVLIGFFHFLRTFIEDRPTKSSTRLNRWA